MSYLQKIPAILVLLVLLLSRPLLAQEVEAETDVTYTFGQVTRFSLEAEGDRPIELSLIHI